MKSVSLASLARGAVLLCALFSSAARADLFEADFGSGVIYRIPANGIKSVYTVGLNAPEGMAFDAAGNFYVSTTGDGIIYKFLTDGTQTVFATGLNGPASLAFDGVGNLFEADFFGNVIYKFAPDGSRTTFATGLNRPANLLFNSGGDLFATDFGSGTIFRFTPAGMRTTFATNVGEPHGLAFNTVDDLFVADFAGGTILRFTPGGARTTFATGLDGPHGLVFDATGDLFSADWNTGTVFRFNPTGGRTTFASGFSNPGNLVFQPARPSANNLLNLSTRTFIGTGDAVLIGGFILQGGNSTTLVLRALGPSLTAQGVSGALADPVLELQDANGMVLASNNDWQTDSDSSAIRRVGLAPMDSHESALRVTLPAGANIRAYTAIVRGAQPGVTGIGLVELYDLQQSNSRAVNISTRGSVLPGNGVMIAGCIIGGSQTKDVIVRGLGPSLTGRGVAGAVNDPQLQLVNSSGTTVAANDNWMQGPDATAIQNFGLAPQIADEAALFATLMPGAYTAIESPAPQNSGIGLIEVYDLSPAP